MRPEDTPAFCSMRLDPDVGRWQGWRALEPPAARAFVGEYAAGPWLRPGHWCQFTIADPATDCFLGDIGVRFPEDPRRPLEVGLSLSRAAQGRGLASEALATLLPALASGDPGGAGTGAGTGPGGCRGEGCAVGATAVTDARNLACVALLERVGFVRVATEAAEFRGLPCVEHHYLWTPVIEAHRE
jgi:RimJ/RimL family protein N-acetyltransferase